MTKWLKIALIYAAGPAAIGVSAALLRPFWLALTTLIGTYLLGLHLGKDFARWP